MQGARDLPAFAGNWLSSPAAPALSALPILVLGAWLALWLQPAPHSDWGYYWDAAGDIAAYERGGLSLWLLAVPKALGMSPVGAALVLNLACVATMLWLSWCADRTRLRVLWLLCAAYLVLIAPYSGIVQLDLMAATQLAAGAWLAFAGPAAWPGLARYGLAVLLVVMAVSTKPQYALTLWAMLGLLLLPWWWLRGYRDRRTLVLALVLLAGSVLGFAVDSGLRSLSGKSEAIRTNSAVTLYAGLLVSGDGPGCGYWSPEATRAAREDLHKRLGRAILDRLGDKPASHWISVVRCKLPEILRPSPYALYWLVESPNVRASIDADPRRERIEARYQHALGWERKLYSMLTLVILVSSVATSVVAWRRGWRLAALVPAAWFGSFWAVHLVFEIQGRYFLGLYLLAPLLCMLVLSIPGRNCPRASGTVVQVDQSG